MLRLLDCSVGYHANLLVQNATFSIELGAIKGIVAPNGYGKSTLMRVASGDFTNLRSGSIEVDGKVYRDSFSHTDVLYVPGDASHLYKHLSVMDHLKMARSMWGVRGSIEACVFQWGIEEFAHKKVRDLSSGMKQQAALAIASFIGPKYLLLDEPTNALDPIHSANAIGIIERMAQGGAGVLISSHLLGTIDELCSSVLFSRDGGIVEMPRRGDISEMFSMCYGAHAMVQD